MSFLVEEVDTGKPVRDKKHVSRKSNKKSNLKQGILAHQPVESYLLAALEIFELHQALLCYTRACIHIYIYFVYQNYH